MYVYIQACKREAWHLSRKRCEQPLRKTNKIIYNSDTIHRGFICSFSFYSVNQPTQIRGKRGYKNKPQPLGKIKKLHKNKKILMFE